MRFLPHDARASSSVAAAQQKRFARRCRSGMFAQFALIAHFRASSCRLTLEMASVMQGAKSMAAKTAGAVAQKTATVVSEAAGAVAAAVLPEPLPPPREAWSYGLFDSCGCSEPDLCCIACCCPCLAMPRIRAYRQSGNPDKRADDCAVYMSLLSCWLCGDGLLAHERDEVRGKTNMVRADCDITRCYFNNACCDDTCSTMCCCGCAAVQMKRELDVWFGLAGEDAPVHGGSPAAKKMARS